ncbi:MAG: hypothetical protein ACK4GB_04635, partial [Tepidimonas sp.]
AVSRHSWDDLEKVLTQHMAAAPDAADTPPIAPEIAEQTARIIDIAQPLVAADDRRLHEQGEELVRYLRLSEHHPPTLKRMLADYAYRLSFGVEEQLGVRQALLGLLKQVFEHIDAISPDNPWLRQQMQALVQAAEPPLSQRRLEDLQSRLKDVIVKQAEAREQTARAGPDARDAGHVFGALGAHRHRHRPIPGQVRGLCARPGARRKPGRHGPRGA